MQRTPRASANGLERFALPGALVLVLALLGGFALLNRMQVGDERNLLTAESPALLQSYELNDRAGQPIWRVSADRPTEISQLKYGVVPPTFRQDFPPDRRPPRPLRDGESLVAKTVLRDGVIEHQGVAVGSDGFLGGTWFSGRTK